LPKRLVPFLLFLIFLITGSSIGLASFAQTPDTSKQTRADSGRVVKDTLRLTLADTVVTGNDSLRFPIADRRGDAMLYPQKNSFDLGDPANVKDSLVYDPATNSYIIYEKIGNDYYRKPGRLSFEEYYRLQASQSEKSYFKDRANTTSLLNRRLEKPALTAHDGLFNRLFGKGKIDIKPQGEVNILGGYQGQNIKNPTLPERARRNGGFDFDMNANINVMGNIGDKLKMPISYNTLSNFDFENQLKLDYTGTQDEIFKKIEVGNTSFATKGTLIPGAQQLFGIKTQMQFGKFWVSTIFASQRSQRQSLSLQGGNNNQQFTLKADAYDENRHFLVAQYFRKNYNTAMKNLPIINSQVQIMRMEVWVTNRTGTTTDTRDIVGLMDIGETEPYRLPPIINPRGGTFPNNGANDLYSKIVSDPNSRDPAFIVNKLTGIGLLPTQDFEKTFARKLDSTQYTYHRQLGFLSLNITLQPDEVLAVAFQYTVNGKVFQVGEFSQDVPVDSSSGVQKILFLKLLKATSPRTRLPIWQLMMKNIYPVGYGQLERSDFQFNVLYEEPGGGEKRYLPEGDQAGVPLLTLVNLDRLNNQNDPQPDGVFDYVEGYTVISPQSRIIFPLLEPFGRDLEFAFQTDPSLRQKYLYYPLYDTIKAIAQTYANLNRFVFKGTARSSGGGGAGDIALNAFNVPQGSVQVTAGGRILQENVDYTIDYVSGNIRIINEAIKNSGVPIKVDYENNATFGVQQRTYLGLRWDYLINQKLSIGGTMVRLSERPFFTKMEYGMDPIRNTMMGVDINYQSELPRLTKWLGKLPNYKPTGNSSITAFAEAAQLKPGHSPQIGKGAEGLIYIDDFEGTKASIDLRFPLISWNLASTPKGATDRNGNILFPEADLFDNLEYGKNRAKFAWYNIEPVLQERRNPNNPIKDLEELSDPRVRSVSQQEIFPQRTPDFGQNQLVTFDLAYYPKERGPYNYDATNVDPSGKLLNSNKRWGGIMRGIDQTDFETANIEFIEFWVLDPFIKGTNPAGGALYFNLGNVSEDVLKDSRRFYENGLPTPTIPSASTTSTWGRSPLNPIQVTQAFSNEPEDRPYQDVGFDGLNDTAEVRVRRDYLTDLGNRFGVGSPAYRAASTDPSSDNFRYYRDPLYDQQTTGILGRYKSFNSPQGNSPIAENNSQFASAFTLYPDSEDFNRDNTLNETEEYFQYRVDLKPSSSAQMQVGQNFIVDRKIVNVSLANGNKENQLWYQFRIPISQYNQKVGEIPDFKSIRFMRMFMTDFVDSAVLRFAKLELVRNNWRRFTFDIDTAGQYKPIDLAGATTFNVSAVNIEENDKRDPIPYRVPPGIERVQALSNGGINILQNEQALSVVLCNLQEGDSRGVFKTLNLDLRQYKKLSMFIHAESLKGQQSLKDGSVNAVIRIGNDFINNFYEIKYPLKITPFGASDPEVIWPEVNSVDFDMGVLVKLKAERNLATANPNTIYRKEVNGKIYSLVGNPNLGEVRGILAGFENNKDPDGTGGPICTEVWINELRLSGIDEEDAWAAVGQVNVQLADLGTVSVSANIHTQGFGGLEQRVNERFRDDFRQIDFSTNLQLGKLLPKKWGIEIPFFANYSELISAPQYDPYDKDILLKDKLNVFRDKRDSIRNDAVDYTSIRTVNFTNIRKLPTGKIRLWSISNFDFSYSFTQTYQHNPLIESNDVRRQQGGVGYTYTGQPKYYEPFKKYKSKSKYLDFVKSFNLNYNPNLIGIRWDARRQFGAIRPRNVGGGPFKIPETYDKYFVMDRIYNMRWDVSRSFNVDFKAINNSRIDEPFGRIDTKPEKDSIRRTFFSGGRNTLYNQAVDFTYNLPTALFPFLDWVTANLTYRTTYGWIGASRLAVSLGNTIQNSNAKGATLEFNLLQLYNKSRLLRKLNEPPGQSLPPDTSDTTKKGKPRANPELRGAGRVFAQLLTSVKRVGATYNEGASTFLPGYMDSTQLFGQNFKSMEPGFGFIFGGQPDSNWLFQKAKNGLITRDPILNNLYRQTYDQRFNLSASVEPFRDLTIDLNMEKTLTRTYNSLFKDTTGLGSFANLNPYASGGFSVSYISFQTLFRKFDPNNISETFKQFQNNRIIVSERLGLQNPYSQVKGSDGYYKGYGRYAQDVLVPSFLAAYTNKDANSIELLRSGNGNYVKANPFAGYLPKPNWRLTFNGLTKIKPLDKVFTNFSVTHAYNSTLSMNSFNSALLYDDYLLLGFPSFLDTISGSFIPYFLVPNISINEQFGPLVGIDFTTVKQFSGRFEYRKSRQLSLSLVDYQLAEVRSTELTFNMRYRKRGQLPFNIRIGKKKDGGGKTESDVTFAIDFSIRDDINSNSRLDQTNAFATGGQKVITIRPTIDYVLSNRVSLQFYFDQRRVTPYISNSAPQVNTRAGVQVRISLAQ
jgi:cell surface protein SprA